ncbi:cysteine desulfurase family protein [Aquihabitans daechungensis]|uniref:cysteine desulfurase family protein n=1 Tax=Aquihabitans daechungensis TaxID=1052257 RepID=UPI003B9F3388
MPSAYLDHAASTPMRPEAIAALVEVLEHTPGNPSGQHRWAREARRRLDDARDGIAGLLGVEPGAVVFTSGGTEADNLAIRGVLGATGGRALCSEIEHHAVLDVVHAFGGGTVAVDASGRLDLDHLADELAADPHVSVVSVMLANNEVGTLQDLDAIADVVDQARPSHPNGLVLHTDAVAAAAWVDVAAAAARADLITISGHKVGGPKGVGVLAVREGVALAPLLIGGGQERERRSGTPDVGGAVALGVAMAVTARDRITVTGRVREQAERLAAGLTEAVEHVRTTVPPRSVEGVANIVHLSCRELSSEALLFLLDEAGVAASAGSSCASGALEPSHVVEALGVAPDWAGGALRLSLGWTTTDEEIDHALEVVPAAIAQLRSASEPAA